MSMNITTSNSTVSGEAPFDLYPYVPSEVAAYIFVFLFGTGALIHFFLLCRFRSPFFLPFFLGCIMEAGGYYGRAWSHKNIRLTGPYVMQYILILSSPPFLAASIYMILGRLARNLDAKECSAMSPRWSSKLFVLVDTICFATQFAGAILSGDTNQQTAHNGSHIVLGGLFLQVFMFCLFIIFTTTFHRRFYRLRGTQLHLKKHLIVLYITSSIFLFRNILRIVEFTQGTTSGFIASHEIMLYLFDGTMMISVVLLFTAIYPGSFFRQIQKQKKGERIHSANEMAPFTKNYGGR